MTGCSSTAPQAVFRHLQSISSSSHVLATQLLPSTVHRHAVSSAPEVVPHQQPHSPLTNQLLEGKNLRPTYRSPCAQNQTKLAQLRQGSLLFCVAHPTVANALEVVCDKGQHNLPAVPLGFREFHNH